MPWDFAWSGNIINNEITKPFSFFANLKSHYKNAPHRSGESYLIFLKTLYLPFLCLIIGLFILIFALMKIPESLNIIMLLSGSFLLLIAVSLYKHKIGWDQKYIHKSDIFGTKTIEWDKITQSDLRDSNYFYVKQKFNIIQIDKGYLGNRQFFRYARSRLKHVPHTRSL